MSGQAKLYTLLVFFQLRFNTPFFRGPRPPVLFVLFIMSKRLSAKNFSLETTLGPPPSEGHGKGQSLGKTFGRLHKAFHTALEKVADEDKKAELTEKGACVALLSVVR